MDHDEEERISAKERIFVAKLQTLFHKYRTIIVVGADKVGSPQIQKFRQSLRGVGELFMGRNSTIRKAIYEYSKHDPHIYSLIGFIKNNVGIFFTNGDVAEIDKKMNQFRKNAYPVEGTIAPSDAIIPRGPTGLNPIDCGGFAPLNIATKILRGQIEIVNDICLIKAGERIGKKETDMFKRLQIKPFSYRLEILYIYGEIYDPFFFQLPPSLPHIINNAYNNILAITFETGYSFPAADEIKQFINNNPASFEHSLVDRFHCEYCLQKWKKQKGNDCCCESSDSDEDLALDLFNDDFYL